MYSIALILVTSCSNDSQMIDGISLDSNEPANQFKMGTLIIDVNERPILSKTQSEDLGFEQLVNDNTKDAILDRQLNKLVVPYDSSLSNKLPGGPNIGICIKVKIARVNPTSNGNCDGNCKDCIGFRCEFVTFPCLVKNSQSREQTANVTVDEVNKEVVYQFYNSVDWDYLMNN